jgi:hypothetical protein
MDEQIRTRMDDTRRTLFEHFDEDVHQRLRLQLDDAKAQLDRFGQRFNLNREDGGRRKFVLVEMGDYFDTVLLPRINRVRLMFEAEGA